MVSVAGFKRKQGRPGIRNLIAVIYTVECARTVAEKIASGSSDARVFGYFPCPPNDSAYKSLVSLGTHPNVGAVLIVALGCEWTDYKKLANDIAASGRETHLLIIQDSGSQKTVSNGRKIIEKMKNSLKNTPRCDIGIKDLIIGIECGGSDATSGLAANPSAGKAADIIISEGGTVIVEEFKELLGCGQILDERAPDEIRPKLRKALDNALKHSKRTKRFAIAAGNIEGGLTTIEEKSMGASCKLGTSPITGFLNRNERPEKPGLYLLDTVYSADRDMLCLCNIGDIYGNTCLSESFAHIILFTTGRGNIVGAALSPVIKITGNANTYNKMADDMDINVGDILEGQVTIDEMGEKIYQEIIRVANGELTKSELNGHYESVVTAQW